MSSPPAGLLQHRLHTQQQRVRAWIRAEDPDLFRTERAVLAIVVGNHHHGFAATEVIAQKAPGGQTPFRQAKQLAGIEHRQVSDLRERTRSSAGAEAAESGHLGTGAIDWGHPSVLEPYPIELAIPLVRLDEENHGTYVLVVRRVHRVEAWLTDREGTRD